jgi:hypothetical protein
MTGFIGKIYAFKFFDSFILIFPLYVAMFVDAGLSPVEISIALLAWSATAFMLDIPAGVVADRAPRRLVLAIAQTGRAAGFGLWLLYPHFWGFLAGLVLWGFKSAFTSGTFEALIYDELAENGRAGDYVRVIGRVRAVQAFAVLAAALCAAASARLGYSFALAASLAAIIAATAAALALPPARQALSVGDKGYLVHLRAGIADALSRPDLRAIIGFGALCVAFGAALEEFWPVFGVKTGLSRPLIAVFVGGQNAVEAAASLLAHRAERWRREAHYAVMVLAGGLLTTAAILFTPWAMLLLAAYSGLLKMLDVVFEARMQAGVGPENRATIGSVKSFCAQIGVIVLYVGFGPMAQFASYRIAFLACGVAALLVGLAWLAASGGVGESPPSAQRTPR